MKNSSFIEFLIFFSFVAFIAAMMNMEADLEANSDAADVENKNNMLNLFEERVAWEDRLDRLSPIGTVAHDSKPETDLFEIVLTATYEDNDEDDEKVDEDEDKTNGDDEDDNEEEDEDHNED